MILRKTGFQLKGLLTALFIIALSCRLVSAQPQTPIECGGFYTGVLTSTSPEPEGDGSKAALLWLSLPEDRFVSFLAHSSAYTPYILLYKRNPDGSRGDYYQVIFGSGSSAYGLLGVEAGDYIVYVLNQSPIVPNPGSFDLTVGCVSVQGISPVPDLRKLQKCGYGGIGNNSDMGLKLSSDGRFLISSADSAAVVWDTATYEPVRVIPNTNGAGRLLSIDISPDGTRIISGAVDRKLLVQDLSTGEIIPWDSTPFEPRPPAKFTPDGLSIYYTDSLNRIRKASAATLAEIGQLPGGGGRVRAIDISDNSQYLAAVTDDPVAAVWNLNTNTNLYAAPLFGLPRSVDINPAGTRVAIAVGNSGVRVLNLLSGVQTNHLGGTNSPVSVKYSSSGARLIVTWGAAVEEYETTGYTLVNTYPLTGAVLSEACHDSSTNHLFVADQSLGIRHLNLSTNTQSGVFSGNVWESYQVGETSDGAHLVSANNWFASVWSSTLGTQTAKYTHPAGPSNLARAIPSTSSALLAFGTLIRRMAIPAGAVEFEFSPPVGGTIEHLSVSPNGLLYVAATGSVARICPATFPAPGPAITGYTDISEVGFTRDNSKVLIGRQNGTIAAHDVSGGGILWTSPFQHGAITSLAPSTIDDTFFSASNDGFVREHSAANGAILRAYPTPSEYAASPVAQSADGKLLIAGNRLWDHQSGELLARLETSDNLRDVHFSASGTKILAANGSGGIAYYEVDAPRALIVAAGDPDSQKNALVSQTCALAGYTGTVLLSRDYERSDIRILSSHLGLGTIDVNGDALDDTDLLLTKDVLLDSLRTWASDGALAGRRLLLHMLDHGIRNNGETLFILNGCETISSSELDAVLDEIQDPLQNGGLHNEVTLVVDCCYSGEFAQSCAPTGQQKRTVVTSTTEDNLAVFLPPPDLTSFSNSFFGAAYMGASIKDSHAAAQSFFQTFTIADQDPQLVDEASGDGTATGFIGASWIYAGAGKGFDFFGDLGSAGATPAGTLAPGTLVTLTVDVESIGDPASVLAQVIPPAPDIEAGQPVTDSLQTISLTNTSGRTWQTTYTVEEEGTYIFGIYGRYADSRRSKPEIVQVSVVEPDPEETRPLIAVIVAGQEDPLAQTGAIDEQALQLTARAYLTAEARGFQAADTRVIGPSALSTLGTPLPQSPTVANLTSAINTLCAAQSGEKLFLSLIGPLAAGGEFELAPGQLLSAAALDSILDGVEAADPQLETIILIDTPKAGAFAAALDSNRRIILGGTDSSGEGFFLPSPTYQSFSRRFLEASRQGRDLYNSYLSGKDFSQLFSTPTPLILDGSGQPVPPRAVGKFLGRRGVFASDAGDLATICDVSPDQNVTTLPQAVVYVDILGGLPPLSVTAEAVPNPPTALVSDSHMVPLTQDILNPSRWQVAPEDLTQLIPASGNWTISYEASYASESAELPRTSRNEKTQLSVGQNNSSPDAYDSDPLWAEDLGSTTLNVLVPRHKQQHTLHDGADVDWMKAYQYFEGATVIPYSITLTNIVIPVGSQLQVDVYRNGIASPADITELIPPGVATRSISFTGSGIAELAIKVSVVGAASPATAYDISWSDDGGANNGIASATGSDTIQLAVDSQGLETALNTRAFRGTAQPGFRVLRSLTGAPGSYAAVNGTLLDLPAPADYGTCPPAPCPCIAAGCVNYTDSGLSPSTVYFYKVELVRSNLTTVAWRGPFYGYTLPAGPSDVADWSLLQEE